MASTTMVTTRRMLAMSLECQDAELEDRGIEISSAGTGALAGYPPSAHAVEVMAERGIDISEHRSRPITVDALLASDYIWVMARHHLESNDEERRKFIRQYFKQDFDDLRFYDILFNTDRASAERIASSILAYMDLSETGTAGSEPLHSPSPDPPKS